MSGYGAYVWSCYGLTVAVLRLECVVARGASCSRADLHAKRRVADAAGDAS